MTKSMQEIAGRLLHVNFDDLSERERRVLQRFVERKRVSRNTNREFAEQLTLGQRVADHVASFGGSWPFLGLFAVILIAWIALNTVLLARSAPPGGSP